MARAFLDLGIAGDTGIEILRDAVAEIVNPAVYREFAASLPGPCTTVVLQAFFTTG